jgi:hypothetical protein
MERKPGPSSIITLAPNAVATTKKEWGPARIIALAAFLVMGASALLAIDKAMNNPTVAALEKANDSVVVGTKPATVGMKLVSGAAIEGKDADSLFVIRYNDGSEVSANGATRVQITRNRGGSELRLERGLVSATLTKQPPNRPFIFDTPVARVTVVGTRLTLAADSHQTKLEVHQGLVELKRTADGQTVRVSEAHQITIRPGVPLRVEPSPTQKLERLAR